MKRQFGWDLPPGVSHHMIEEQAGAFEKTKPPYSLRIKSLIESTHGGMDWKITGFNIEIYKDVPYVPNYNLPTELNKPEVFFVTTIEELLEFLKGIYDREQ